MFADLAAGLALWCWRHAKLVLLVAIVATAALAAFAATHLGLDTDQTKLISADVPFRQAEQRHDRAFPQDINLLLAVIDARTSSDAEHAADALVAALAPRTDIFSSIRRPPEEKFFRASGLLFMSTEELTDLAHSLTNAQPLTSALADEPSLRRFLSLIDLGLDGVTKGEVKVTDIDPMIAALDPAMEAAAANKPSPPFSLGAVTGQSAGPPDTRRIILAQPVLNFDSLTAGQQAETAIRDEARSLGFTPENGYRLRLTGEVALADANFASLAQGTAITIPLSLLLVCGFLYWATRSARVSVAILASLIVGLIATAAFASARGDLNPISVAFAVMFVGIAVDFAIQFAVRFRDERYRIADPALALASAARRLAAPLSLAAIATAAGFLSFVPTAYSGVSQLGLIAGVGMIIALLVDVTLLPALLAILRPRPAQEPVGLKLAQADRFLAHRCRAVLLSAALLALVGVALLPFLRIQFDPLRLLDAKSEAVSTLLDLARDPDGGIYAVDALAPTQQAAQELTSRFEALPLVARTMTIADFTPDQQKEKLDILSSLADDLGPAPTIAAPPAPISDNELRPLLNSLADHLDKMAKDDEAAASLATHLRAAAQVPAQALTDMQANIAAGLADQLTQMAQVTQVRPVVDPLPSDLVRNWVSPDAVRVQITPKEDMSNEAAARRFIDELKKISPDLTGTPVSMVETGRAVFDAFAEAGLAALVAIALLLGLMLRRVLDAVLVVLPLVMGALYTVIGAVIGGFAINLANIIALPLLLGIGVAFNIYFVVNWRKGETAPLRSATARAVLFSALTTSGAFGTLALSPHPGTASMGLLLFMSLSLSVATTFIVLPAMFAWLDERSLRRGRRAS